MPAQISWATGVATVDQTPFFEVDTATSADVAIDNELRTFRLPRIVNDSASLRRVLDMVRVVAPTNATVLINGETGTGKALIAEAVHKGSPFIKVNCAAIPIGLLEASGSVTSAGHSPARSRDASDASNWLAVAPYSWMR
jgi:transcriptional regulator with PAS, ATPase and Fis domain